MITQWEHTFLELPGDTPPEQIAEALMGAGADGWEPWHLSRSQTADLRGVLVVFVKRPAASPLVGPDGGALLRRAGEPT